VIGSTCDTTDPADVEWMAAQPPNGRYLYSPDGCNTAMYDHQRTCFRGLADFIQSVHARY